MGNNFFFFDGLGAAGRETGTTAKAVVGILWAITALPLTL
jgi:hypothetical protein